MGYYTRHELSFSVQPDAEKLMEMQKIAATCLAAGVSVPPEAKAIIEDPANAVILAIQGHQNLRDCLGDSGTGEGVDSCKWYEHQDDMKWLSAKFPDVLFTLHGEGEDPGDLWTEYYKGGKCQVEKAMIQIAPFDPKKLS